MEHSPPIRILEKDNNRRGDLFTRLMADLFVALGYEQPRMNIHKTGRELDLSADHVLERRHAIAECKATRDKVGGDELNKLAGRLDVEGVKEAERGIVGYFISLGGFTEPAIEQERERRKTGKTEIVLIDGKRVVAGLVRGRILIPKERATELAGRCCSGLDHLELDPDLEVLAHQRGWIWAVFFTEGKARTHFALIHADGTPLARMIANEVVAADRSGGGRLFELICRNPPPLPGSDEDPRVVEALATYNRYLVAECGFIQLDGMPADSDVGSRRLALENLFVPLHLDLPQKEKKRQPVGSVLADHPRLALLAAPGGGKSTLIKRLAVAYTDPLRRALGDDELPNSDWLPLFFRCRELRELARGSFADLLDALSQRELVRQYARVFRAAVDRALLAGRVLLLVDGLDEISDASDRAAFVCTLRTALQAYPKIAFVVTSREAGFRHVAAHLAPVCTQATLSPFDEDDIRRLSVAWHREVVGEHEKVREDAEALATSIAKNDRILRLASNPLLLTTLLLVKRWVGSLPTRRAVLYGKAVEVLLMTWNTEGHESIPQEEALPQLCYVASAMMLEGMQKVSRPRLVARLREARAALPTELGYVRGTVEEFIGRVEDRSSLLMMTGHEVENGQLVEVFEFRHLTFQEFLTARAMVEGWHPGRKPDDTLAGVLEPRFEEEAWREVIPLAAVLGGKQTEALLQRLTEALKDVPSEVSKWSPSNPPFLALANCLTDEASARPETIQAAIRELIRFGNSWGQLSSLLARGRYGADLREEARQAFLASTPSSSGLNTALSAALSSTVFWQTVEVETMSGYLAAAERFATVIRSTKSLERCEGALGGMELCYLLQADFQEAERQSLAVPLCRLGDALTSMLYLDSAYDQFTAAWALAWLGACHVWVPPAEPDLLGRLFFLWQNADNSEVRRMAEWAFRNQLLGERGEGGRCSSIDREELGRKLVSDPNTQHKAGIAALIAAWYCFALSDTEIFKRATEGRSSTETRPLNTNLRNLLDRLHVEPRSKKSRRQKPKAVKPRMPGP